jgi:hypothetical protein
MALPIHKFVCFKQTWRGAQLSTGTSNSQVCMFQTSMRCECSCLMALLIHKTVRFRHTWDGAQLSDVTSTSQVCIFRTDTPRESNCQMALLRHKAVCFKQTLCVSAAVKWHFYFTSVHGSYRHHARIQLSDGTSTLHVCMCQSYTTRECSCHMPLLRHTSVCLKQTSRVSAALWWHFYFKSVYVSNRHHAWLRLPDGTPTSHVCMFQKQITRESSCHMELRIHTCVYFKQTWGGAQLSYGTATSQGYMFQTEITREFSCQMGLLLHKCIYFVQKIRVRANAIWHFYFTSAYISNRHYAWVQLSDGTSASQVCMLQTDITRECSCQMSLLLHKCVCFR